MEQGGGGAAPSPWGLLSLHSPMASRPLLLCRSCARRHTARPSPAPPPRPLYPDPGQCVRSGAGRGCRRAPGAALRPRATGVSGKDRGCPPPRGSAGLGRAAASSQEKKGGLGGVLAPAPADLCAFPALSTPLARKCLGRRASLPASGSQGLGAAREHPPAPSLQCTPGTQTGHGSHRRRPEGRVGVGPRLRPPGSARDSDTRHFAAPKAGVGRGGPGTPPREAGGRPVEGRGPWSPSEGAQGGLGGRPGTGSREEKQREP